MSVHLDHVLRETLAEIADARPPAGLARTVVRQAARQRAVARVTVGAASALAVGLVATPFAIRAVDPDRPAVQGGGPGSGAGRPLAPPGGFVVTAYSGIADPGDPGPADDDSLVLNPAKGTYDKLPYNGVSPSPDGNRVVVHQGDNSAAHPSRTGLLDRRTGAVRWMPGIGGYHQAARWAAEWSPDGSRILFTVMPKEGPGGFAIVDAGTLAVTTVTTGDASTDVSTNNSMGLGFVWAPDGDGVALTLSSSGGSESEPDSATGIRFYDLRGRTVRVLDSFDGALEAGAAFSLDGHRIALAENPVPGTDVPQSIRIVDAATGRSVTKINKPFAGVLGWYDDRHLIVRLTAAAGTEQGPGGEVGDMIQVVDFAGNVVRSVRLEQGAWAARVYVGEAGDLKGAAAKLTF